MTKQEFEDLDLKKQPILSLNKDIGYTKKETLLKLVLVDTEGELIEVTEIYGTSQTFWVKYENVDLKCFNKTTKLKIK